MWMNTMVSSLLRFLYLSSIVAFCCLLISPHVMEEDEPPRKRYKLYGEPFNVGATIPKTTAWRFQNRNENEAGQCSSSNPSSSSSCVEGGEAAGETVLECHPSIGPNTSHEETADENYDTSLDNTRDGLVEEEAEESETALSHEDGDDGDSCTDVCDLSVHVPLDDSSSQYDREVESPSSFHSGILSCHQTRRTEAVQMRLEQTLATSVNECERRSPLTPQDENSSDESLASQGAKSSSSTTHSSRISAQQLLTEAHTNDRQDSHDNMNDGESTEDDTSSDDESMSEMTHPIGDYDSDLDSESSDGGSVGEDNDHQSSISEEDREDQPQSNDSEKDEENPEIDNHQQPPSPHPCPPPQPHQKLKDKLQGVYSERITDPVALSRGEVLLNIQEFCKQHPIPQSAQEDLHRLINTLFSKEVVPASTFKLDKLYSAEGMVKRIFFCSKCSENFGELDHKKVISHTCPECGADNKIHDLTKASYFIIIDFVQQLQLLLDDPNVASELKNPDEFANNGDTIKDLYDGDMYKKFVAFLDFVNGKYYMSFTACTDGTPLFKSSTLSIWPIFVMINELPPYRRMSNILLAGLWFGKSHPKMDLFLEPFCDYMQKLSLVGFHLRVSNEVRLYHAYLIAVCADSGARGSIQCVHLHNGEYPCNWCLHPGEVEGGGSNARKFRQERTEERTEDQMFNDGRAVLELPGENNSINGVTGVSPLFRCPKFHIVDGMILDHLHWASFGVARRMGKLWLGETKKEKSKKKGTKEKKEMPAYYIGTDETKAVINKRIAKIRPTREVRRMLRDLSQLSHYNAKEWENMILYFSVPLFKNLLPDKFLSHWILFVQAFYIFMKSVLKRSEIEIAGFLMKGYVDGILELYGLTELTFNNHISNHAMDHVLRWGALWSISSFAFENGNKVLKSKIYAERGIGHQIVRSLERDSSLQVLRNLASTSQTSSFRSRLLRKEVKKSFCAGNIRCIMPKTFSPTEEELRLCERQHIDVAEFVECSRIIAQNVCYGKDTGAKTDNSYAYCESGKVMKIRKIIANEMSGEVYLFVSRVRCHPYPLPRGYRNNDISPFMHCVDLIEQGVSLLKSNALITVCVNIKIDDQFYSGQFVSIMPNTQNMF